MHEVALCRQLAAAVSRATRARGVPAESVGTVYVEVGALRQVVSQAMEFAWTFVVRDTPLADARLEMRLLPAVIRCRACGATRTLGPELGFDCRACGSGDTEVVGGEQFVLTAVDLRTTPRPQPPEAWHSVPESSVPEKGDQDGTLPPP